jgi:hypothetical protein
VSTQSFFATLERRTEVLIAEMDETPAGDELSANPATIRSAR